MEPQLFYWTGKIIWYAVCIALCASMGVLAIAPIAAFYKLRQHLWHWKLSAEIAKYGFTEADVRYAVSLQGDLPCKYEDLIEAVGRIKARGDAIKQRERR